MAQVGRLRAIALVLLTLGSGATDAIAFLGLGGTFTANMTGNLVLIGLVGREDYAGTAVRATVACVAFAARCIWASGSHGFFFCCESSSRCRPPSWSCGGLPKRRCHRAR
jgi:uncharacterized membrane protein YoaK (UPF0700 family)